jgi:membrane fusion protein, multidrug efflux system
VTPIRKRPDTGGLQPYKRKPPSRNLHAPRREDAFRPPQIIEGNFGAETFRDFAGKVPLQPPFDDPLAQKEHDSAPKQHNHNQGQQYPQHLHPDNKALSVTGGQNAVFGFVLCMFSLGGFIGRSMKGNLWLALPAVAVAAALTGCPKPPKPTPPEFVVPVAPPVQKNVPIVREWVGLTYGMVNADIIAQVTGYLVSQNYEDGSMVKKGQLLFQIDPRPFQAALDQAAGTFEQAKAALIRDEANAKRAVDLLSKNVISREQYDDQIQAFESSKAGVSAAQAAVEQARLNLEFTSILAPVDGLAAIANAQVGNLIGPSTGTLTTVTMVDPIKVKFFISETEYLQFIQPYFGDPDKLIKATDRGGLGFQILLTDQTVYPQPGRLLAVNNQVSQNTGSLQIEAVFPNQGSLLRAGQFARVRGVTSWINDALLVPQRAINDLQGKSQVAVIGADGKVDLRLVETGPTYASMQVVTSGLQPGETVVVEGMQKLRQGMTVKTSPWVMPPGFAEDPSLPAPVEPKDENFEKMPPTAQVDDDTPPVPPAAPTPPPPPVPPAVPTPPPVPPVPNPA